MFHATSALRVCLAVSLLLVTVPSTPAHAAAQKGPEARLLERALKLLPERANRSCAADRSGSDGRP